MSSGWVRLSMSIDFLTDAKGVSCSSEIEQLREKVYGTLEEYSRTAYPDEPGRFAKLLLRLPALRSIGSYLCSILQDKNIHGNFIEPPDSKWAMVNGS